MRISQRSARLAAHSWHTQLDTAAHSAWRGGLVAERVRVWQRKINVLVLVLVTNRARFIFCWQVLAGTGLSAQCAPLEEACGEVAHVLGAVEDLVQPVLRVLARQALIRAHHLFELALSIWVAWVLICCVQEGEKEFRRFGRGAGGSGGIEGTEPTSAPYHVPDYNHTLPHGHTYEWLSRTDQGAAAGRIYDGCHGPRAVRWVVKARCLLIHAEASLSHGGQGESLVPPHTHRNLSLPHAPSASQQAGSTTGHGVRATG